jgi:hypothetical protein
VCYSKGLTVESYDLAGLDFLYSRNIFYGFLQGADVLRHYGSLQQNDGVDERSNEHFDMEVRNQNVMYERGRLFHLGSSAFYIVKVVPLGVPRIGAKDV